MDLPKVLIINQPFNNDTGGGITLTNLFAGWDKDKLAVVCSGYILADNIDTQVCDTYYQLGYKERKWIFPFRFFKRKYQSGLIEFDQKRIQDLTIPKSKVRVKMIMDYIYPFLEYIGLSHCISKTGLSPDLRDWLDSYNPDVVYAQASGREDTLFCLTLNSYLKKPLVFHMMDDWPSLVGRKGLLKSYWPKKIDREFRKLLNQADVLMSISDYMAEEYKRRYNKDFITFHNPINIQFWQSHQRTDYEMNESPKILYAGRIGLGIDTSLQLIADAIKRVNEDLQISIKFVLQSQEKPSWTKDYKNVTHKSFVNYNDLPKVFSKADVLILPYDFSQQSINFIKYSMPTKASEYMASGTPIIIFAPADTALVNYAKSNGWANVITENNTDRLSAAIKYLVLNKNVRQQLAQKAIDIAESNHNSTKVKNHFRSLICSVTDKEVKI